MTRVGTPTECGVSGGLLRPPTATPFERITDSAVRPATTHSDARPAHEARSERTSGKHSAKNSEAYGQCRRPSGFLIAVLAVFVFFGPAPVSAVPGIEKIGSDFM